MMASQSVIASRSQSCIRVQPFSASVPKRRAVFTVRAESDIEKNAKKTAESVGDAADRAKRTVEDTSNISPEMKKRMRDEYVGFGGAPNAPLKNNYFLWIIVGIGSLAILSYLTGAI